MKYIRRTLTALLTATLMAADAHAVPASPHPITVMQADGTCLTLQLVGDENYHYYRTTDGVPVMRVGSDFRYATITPDGTLAPSGMLVHDAPARTLVEHEFVRMHSQQATQCIQAEWSTRLQARNSQRAQRTEARRARRHAFGQSSKIVGHKRGLVILVNYADLSMRATSSRTAWDNQFNQPGYNKNNHYGSVRDYFLDQSYQQLEIDFDVVGPYTVSQPWRYYGKQRDGSDVHPCQLVTEACRLADADVDFSQYDWDGDGEVDQVFVVYAGYSAAAGYDEDAIWPHEWHLDYGAYYGDGQGAITLDGMRVNQYALSSELQGTSGSTMDPIGTAVHEFSHCLGLPDFYDVDGRGTQCMDYWDVLDAGCYSGPEWKGEVPTGYTAYERHFAGWLDYTELKDPQRVDALENLGDAPQAYIHYNQGNRNEYFILENRQARGWFRYPVQAHGLFIYHVDYNRDLWLNDRPNSDPSHPRMTYVPADRSFDRSYTSQMVSDFFPGTNAVKSLTNTSHAACYGTMFNKNADGTYNMNMELTNIRELSGRVYFTYNGGEAAVRTQLRTLVTDVQAMLQVPHADVQEGATALLQQSVAQAQETAALTTCTSAEYMQAMSALRQSAADFLFAANPADTLQPFDITFMITNPAIATNEGWKEETANNGFDCANNCGEYNDIKFNLAQTITSKLPRGQFTATCQAFQRPGQAIDCGTRTVSATFYARGTSVRIHHITDDAQAIRKTSTDTQLPDVGYIPTNSKSASTYFRAGLYTNTVRFEITSTTGTSVKIGLKSLIAKADYWTCFGNFHLYFHGDPSVTPIRDVTTRSTAPTGVIHDLSGRRIPYTQHLRPGIYLIDGRKVSVR